ncbi:MAG: S8 family serine peptidase [Clostridiales bacterium]|nr:S8 family serine peptidase [Clostridiales bacterium]
MQKNAVEKLVNAQGGEIVGYIDISNDYQIYFSEGKTYEELQDIIDEWNENEKVEAASLDYVSQEETSSIDYSHDPWQAKTEKDYLSNLETDPKWNILSPGGSNWWAETLQLTAVWNMDIEWSTVKVGIYDTMFDTANEDLQGCFAENGLYDNPDDVNGLYQSDLDAQADGEEVEDIVNVYHGTHVAGIIGAQANSFGIAGISQNAELYGFACFGDETYDYVSDMKTKYGLASLLSNGVKVINMSMNDPYLSVSAQYDEEEGLDEEDSASIRELNRQSEMLTTFLTKCLDKYDFLIVVSAGNENGYHWILNQDITDENPYSLVMGSSENKDEWIDITYDTKYDAFAHISDENVRNHILMVGAITLSEERDTVLRYEEAGYSAKNADIYAPGTDILSDFPTNYIDYQSGTSMAAPMVTGVAALVWGVNPDLTALEVRDILLEYNAGDDLKWSDKIVSASHAVCYAVRTLFENTEEGENGGDEDVRMILGCAYKTGPDISEDADKELVTDATFTIYKEGQEEDTAEMVCGEDGTFTLLVVPGEYVIEVSADGYNSATYRVETSEDRVNYTEIPMTMTATDVQWENVRDGEDEDSDLYHSVITGVNDAGEVCWRNTTEQWYVLNTEECDEIGTYDGQFLYYISDETTDDVFDDYYVTSLNIADGEMLWKTKTNFSNFVSSFYTFGDNGNLYLASSSSPNLIVIDKNGTILKEVTVAELEETDGSWYPYEVIYESGFLTINMYELYGDEDAPEVQVVVDTSDYTYTCETLYYPELGSSAEGEAYRQFLLAGNYPSGFSSLEGQEYAFYDINGDGVKELIFHALTDAFTDEYYFYTYSGGQVIYVGDLENTSNGAIGMMYYSADLNAFAVITRTSSNWTYLFYKINNGIQQDAIIGWVDTKELDENRQKIFIYSYTDADGESRELTEEEYTAYEEEFVELEFSEL